MKNVLPAKGRNMNYAVLVIRMQEVANVLLVRDQSFVRKMAILISEMGILVIPGQGSVGFVLVREKSIIKIQSLISGISIKVRNVQLVTERENALLAMELESVKFVTERVPASYAKVQGFPAILAKTVMAPEKGKKQQKPARFARAKSIYKKIA